jgi:ABC-type transport system involved in multi-copper enzyme maturation permease subunit
MIRQIWFKEIRAELYTWKSTIWLLIASLLFSFTSYLLLTDKELSLLDQTELLLLLGKIIIGVSLLIITIDASSIITSEFEKETAESIFLSPVSLKEFVFGKLCASLSLWGLIYIISIPYIIVASSGSKLAASFLIYTALLGTIAVISFILIIFAVSLLYRSTKNTLTTSLILILVFVIPALFSSPLKGNAVIGFFSKINPIDNVFSSLDNVLVDYQTSILLNLKYLLPLIGFLLVGGLLLWIAMRKFNRDGIIKNS